MTITRVLPTRWFDRLSILGVAVRDGQRPAVVVPAVDVAVDQEATVEFRRWQRLEFGAQRQPRVPAATAPRY